MAVSTAISLLGRAHRFPGAAARVGDLRGLVIQPKPPRFFLRAVDFGASFPEPGFIFLLLAIGGSQALPCRVPRSLGQFIPLLKNPFKRSEQDGFEIKMK